MSGRLGLMQALVGCRLASSQAQVPQPKIRLATEDEILGPKLDDGRRIPTYPPVNIRLRGLDFQVLEQFQAYAGKAARRLGLQTRLWAAPARRATVTNLKPRSAIVEAAHDLATFERHVQLLACPSTTLPPLLSLLAAQLPEGVSLTLKAHERADEESRYIPDYELQAMQRELRSLDEPSVRAKLGWGADPNAA